MRTTNKLLSIGKNKKSYNDFTRVVNDYIYYYNNIRIKGKTNWMSSGQYRLKFGS